MVIWDPSWGTSTSTSTSTGSTTGWIEVRDQVWGRWTAGTGGYTTNATTVQYQYVWNDWNERQETEQERRDRQQRYQEERNRQALRAEQHRQLEAQANERALELLELILTDEETEGGAITDLAHLQIRGSDGYIYRVRLDYGVHGNITRMDDHGCRLGNVCVAPQMRDRETGQVIPHYDGIVGQVLGLKFDAEEFLSHGNWSSTGRCTQVLQTVDNTEDVYIEDDGDIVFDELVPLVEHQWTEEEIAALEDARDELRGVANIVGPDETGRWYAA